MTCQPTGSVYRDVTTQKVLTAVNGLIHTLQRDGHVGQGNYRLILHVHCGKVDKVGDIKVERGLIEIGP